MKIIIKESKRDKLILNWLDKNYSDLKKFESRAHFADIVFFVKNGNVIFVYEKDNNVVGVSYVNLWSILESFFNLNYDEISDIMKLWVEKNYDFPISRVIGTVPRNTVP